MALLPVVRGQALWSPGGLGARACVCDDSAVPVVVGSGHPWKDPPRKLAWLPPEWAAVTPGHLRHPGLALAVVPPLVPGLRLFPAPGATLPGTQQLGLRGLGAPLAHVSLSWKCLIRRL